MEALLSVRELRQVLGVSTQTVYRLIKGGEIAVVKLGDRNLFRPEDVRALVEQSMRRREPS